MAATSRHAVLRWLVEAFAASNLAFLTIDLWFAHSMNHFASPAEWIPLIFSIVATLLLLPGLISGTPSEGRAHVLGWWVGVAAIAIGITGLILHLHKTFFIENTLHNLVYTAPFAAPLAYAGLGLLLLLVRTERAGSPEFARWVLLLAAGGFAGNFALALADHAQNGFFHRTEWISVVAGAFGTVFLTLVVMRPDDHPLARACQFVLLLEIGVGAVGEGLHLKAIWNGSSASLLENSIYAAPLFAPLLFIDLAMLGFLGMLARQISETEAFEPIPTSPPVAESPGVSRS